MIINLAELHGGDTRYPIENDGWFPHEQIRPTAPVTGSITITRVSEEGSLVKGEFGARGEAVCDRCGEPAQLVFSKEFIYDCIIGKDDPLERQDVESKEEDANKLYLDEPLINVGELLREQILLAMPLRVLCKQSCKGLCFQCGADLNTETCTCVENVVLSSFAVLKKIKGR